MWVYLLNVSIVTKCVYSYIVSAIINCKFCYKMWILFLTVIAVTDSDFSY